MKLEEMDQRIHEDANGCWVWTGPKSPNGYGQVYYEGKSWRVHRLAYTLKHGSIPRGKVLDHLCRNRACCNPDHLEPVTDLENIRRSPIHNATKVTCKQGHRFTRENTGINRHAGRERRFCRTCQRHWNREAARKRRAKLAS